ncbi:MAG: transcriptional regulator [Gemmatimonadota bacterium]
MAEPRPLSNFWPPSSQSDPALRSEPGGSAETGPAEFDRLIHERVRLGIVSALAVNDCLSFNELKAMLRVTDGNLSVHARKLEEAGYLECSKTFNGRVPRTDYRLTSLGRRAFERYLDHMEALIDAVRET